jgi:hypothetical protein
MDNSDSEESGDAKIDLVIRKKDAEESDVIGRIPLKKVLKAKKKRFEQPDSSGSDEDDSKQALPQPKISKSKAKIQDMEKNIKN